MFLYLSGLPLDSHSNSVAQIFPSVKSCSHCLGLNSLQNQNQSLYLLKLSPILFSSPKYLTFFSMAQWPQQPRFSRSFRLSQCALCSCKYHRAAVWLFLLTSYRTVLPLYQRLLKLFHFALVVCLFVWVFEAGLTLKPMLVSNSQPSCLSLPIWGLSKSAQPHELSALFH